MNVKFISNSSGWFKPGTECLWVDNQLNYRRPTVKEFERLKEYGGSLFYGTRVSQKGDSVNFDGREIQCEQWCYLNEFNFEFVD